MDLLSKGSNNCKRHSTVKQCDTSPSYQRRCLYCILGICSPLKTPNSTIATCVPVLVQVSGRDSTRGEHPLADCTLLTYKYNTRLSSPATGGDMTFPAQKYLVMRASVSSVEPKPYSTAPNLLLKRNYRPTTLKWNGQLPN